MKTRFRNGGRVEEGGRASPSTSGTLGSGVAPEPVVPVLEMGWADGEITSAKRGLPVKFARSRGSMGTASQTSS